MDNDDLKKQGERDRLIESLSLEDLRKFSSRQLMACRQVDLERVNKNARERVRTALKEQVTDIAKALTMAPFVYMSPEIQVMAGCRVKFASPIRAQTTDAHAQLNTFISECAPNEMQVSDQLNALLVAHSLYWYNDTDFGGVMFDAGEYQALRALKPEEAQKMLDAVRNARMSALEALSPHLHQRLVEYYQAFQMTIDEITRGEEMGDALGN